MGSFGFMQDLMGQYKTIQDHTGHTVPYMEPNETIWEQTGPYGTIPTLTGTFGNIRDHTDPYGTIGDHTGP